MSKDEFVFDGFEPANTTAVPDVLFDVLLPNLSGAELKVLLYIIRRTRGFKKDTDAISLTQFEKGITTKKGKVLDAGCGLSRETICKALQSLEEMGCILSQKRSNSRNEKDITLYSIHFKTHQMPEENLTTLVGKSDYHLVGKSDQGSRKILTRVVGKSDIQQTVLQQTVKQETESDADRVSPTPPISSINQQERAEQGSLIPDDSKKTRRTVPPASPDASRIIERWIAANGGKPIPMTKALIEAAEALVDCNPSKETLICVKNFAWLNDSNGWYKKHGGVKLGDIVREYEGWQNSQNQAQAEQPPPPPIPLKPMKSRLVQDLDEKRERYANKKG